jgi:hypothetical protein
MKTTITILAGLTMLVSLVPQNAPATTIPAGTILIVRTLDSIVSTDTPGTRFAAQLATTVEVGGNAVLNPGTKLSGKIVTSRRTVSSSQRLTVSLTDVQVGGRAVPIKTMAIPLSNDYQTKRGISVSRAAYTVPAGKQIQFQLAHPFNL